jgi:GTP-binding protein Era
MGEKINIEKKLHQKFTDGTVPVIILINKIDLSTQNEVDLTIQTIQEQYPKSEVFAISALKNFNIESVLNRLIDLVPLSPPYFPKDQFTDKPERFFVNEILRQKIFMYYDKEIPYSVEVQTEEFIEKPSIIKLRCYIIVERESQKGIIIGHRGIALKKIGSKARTDLEVFFKKKIFIEIKVKVSKNWRSSDIELKKFGYK